MPLFEFELAPVEEIPPWGEPGSLKLTWFALTDGIFRINAGEQTLFRYTPEILAHWGRRQPDADYQIAAFARDVLESAAPALAPLSPFVESLASDWNLLMRLQERSREQAKLSKENAERHSTAWGWLGERSPCMTYFLAYPKLAFLRFGNEVRLCWDNTPCRIDGITVWTARTGVLPMSADTFVAECRSFTGRLLDAMEARITDLEAGRGQPQTAVDIASLRQQHQSWSASLAGYFGEQDPDVPWDETEAALRAIAGKTGVLPAP
jgi:hypothetical protein